MEVIKTPIEGVLIIEPRVFGDKRGYFFESFNACEFAEKTGLQITGCCEGCISNVHHMPKASWCG